MLSQRLNYLFCLFVFSTLTSFTKCNDAHDRRDFIISMKKLLLEIENHPNLTWVPELPSKFTTFQNVSVLLGALTPSDDHKRDVHVVNHKNDIVPIPKLFDSRTRWKKCPSIGKIRDQSNCGSCWAFGAVEAMSDRICIQSNGKIKVTLSAVDLVSCCTSCGFGCHGGYLIRAWKYWVEHGIVTGGSNETHKGCRPYPFSKCEHHSKGKYKNCSKQYFDTPKCIQKCQPSYKKSYNKDKYFGKLSYEVRNDQSDIQKEIMKHGPVEASFLVYEDFFLYKSGIYQHIKGNVVGFHAIKIIGWGVKHGTPYWLCVNSWNEDWGEKGLFKILRGEDHCQIENGINAGVPKN